MTPTISVQDVFRIIHDAVAHGVWWPLAGLVLVFIVAALRKVAAAKMGKVGAWLATDHGAIVLAFLTAGFSGISAALLGGAAPSKATLIGALLSGATAVFAFPKVRQLVQSWFGVDLGLGDLTGKWQVVTAANGKQSVTKVEVQPPPHPRSGEGGFIHTGFLWIILVLALCGLVLACAGAQVWKTCELGQLPQIAETVIPTVVQDLGGVNQETALSQVEEDAGSLLPGQLSCVVQAIIADVQTRAAKVKGQLGPVQENIVHNGKAYLAKHPALACGEPPPLIHASIESSVSKVYAASPPRVL